MTTSYRAIVIPVLVQFGDLVKTVLFALMNATVLIL